MELYTAESERKQVFGELEDGGDADRLKNPVKLGAISDPFGGLFPFA